MEEGFGVRGKRRYVGEEEREEEIEELRLWVLGVFAMVFSRAGFVVMRIYTPWLGWCSRWRGCPLNWSWDFSRKPGIEG